MPSRWIAVLPLAATEQHGPHLPLGNRRHDRRGLSGAGARTAACQLPATFLPLQPVGISTEHIDYPGTLTLPTGRRAEGMDGARRKRRASGIRKLVMVTSHGGNSAAMTLVAQDLRAQPWASRGHHELVALRRAGRIVLGARNCVMASMAARSRPRSCWRDIRRPCGRKRSPIFVPPASRWRRNFAGFRRTGRRRLPGRRRISIPAAQPATRQRRTAEKGERLLDHGARAFCELLADVDKFDVKRLAAGPNDSPK